MIRIGAVLMALGTLVQPLRTQDEAPAPVAVLIAAANWSLQCDPIRFSLRLASDGGDVVMRVKEGGGGDALFPFAVERRDGDRWVPVRVASGDPLGHPARYVIQTNGRRVGPDAGLMVEADLWHLDATSVPGRIRIRFLLETRVITKDDIAKKGAAERATSFTELPTPWLEIDVRPHEGNATHLLGSDTGAERAAFERMMLALNSTWAVQRNRGPVNFGPTLPSLRHWQDHVPVAERLVGDARVSWRIRARARLVLAHDAIERAARADGETRDEALRVASAHLEADELVAAPPSGGLEALPSGGFEPLRRMLLARIEGMRGGRDPRLVRGELRERYPFFAMWWDAESAEFLTR